MVTTLEQIRTRHALALDPFAAEDNRLEARLRLLRHDVPELLRRLAAPAPSREQVAATIAQFFGPNDSPEDAADAVLALFEKGAEG